MKKIGIVLLILFLLTIIPFDQSVQTDVSKMFLDASSEHLLGTDYLGRDIFTLLKYGFLRTASVVFVGTLVGLIGGVVLGLIGGYMGGIVLRFVKSFSDLTLIVPSFIVALIISSLFGANPISIGMAIGFFDIGTYANQVASLTKNLKNRDFIVMSELLNVPKHKIIFSHILPNISEPVSALFANRASSLIIKYASLTFIGLGTDITKPDWGTLLYEYRIYMINKPMLLFWPSFGILIFALFFHFVFDSKKLKKGGLHV